MKKRSWILIVKIKPDQDLYGIIHQINLIELKPYISNIQIAGQGSSIPNCILVYTTGIENGSTIPGFLEDQIKEIDGVLEIEKIEIEFVNKTKLREYK